MDTDNQAATAQPEGDNLSPEERRLRGIPEQKPEGKSEAETDDKADAAKDDESAEGEGDDDGDEGEEEKPKKRRRRNYSDLKAELRELRARLDTQEKPTEAKSEGKENARPKLEEFKTYDDYQEALTDWKVDQRLKAERENGSKRQREIADREYQGELNAHVNKSVDKAKDKYEDFEDVLADNGAFLKGAMLRLVSETDDPGEIAYYLANNPAEAKRISALNPVKAAVALGKLEAKLAAPAPKKVSKAPPPPGSVGNGKSQPKPTNKLSPDELYRKLRVG